MFEIKEAYIYIIYLEAYSEALFPISVFSSGVNVSTPFINFAFNDSK